MRRASNPNTASSLAGRIIPSTAKTEPGLSRWNSLESEACDTKCKSQKNHWDLQNIITNSSQQCNPYNQINALPLWTARTAFQTWLSKQRAYKTRKNQNWQRFTTEQELQV